MADADAEERGAAAHGALDRGVDRVRLQPAHRRDERADAGEHGLARARDRVRVARDVELRAGGAQGAGDVRDVRDGRVDERYVQITPFVLGTPLPTTAFASRSAIAN